MGVSAGRMNTSSCLPSFLAAHFRRDSPDGRARCDRSMRWRWRRKQQRAYANVVEGDGAGSQPQPWASRREHHSSWLRIRGEQDGQNRIEANGAGSQERYDGRVRPLPRGHDRAQHRSGHVHRARIVVRFSVWRDALHRRRADGRCQVTDAAVVAGKRALLGTRVGGFDLLRIDLRSPGIDSLPAPPRHRYNPAACRGSLGGRARD